MHDEFLKRPEWWARDATTGKVCRQNGDRTFPNHTGMLSFDFAQSAVRDFWASECVNMTRTGVVDGCFSDRSVGGNCEKTPEFAAGHLRVHQELQRALGNGVLIANAGFDMPGVSGTQIEGFKADEASIKTLQQCVANGKITEAHAGYGADGADDHCGNITNSLAAFLIGAGPRSYYACSRGWKVQEDPIGSVWHPEYEKPLGSPAGPAVKDADGVYTRRFESAKGTTLVTFDTRHNTGRIEWAGE